MIAFLRGQLYSRGENQCIIECGGVGYLVRCSQYTLQELPASGPVFVHIYHHIIENDQQLFGFAAMEERMAFEQLITVKGIGPKLALAVLSGILYSELIEIILKKQAALLSRVPGIGKKTAERIILELSDRITATAKEAGLSVPAAALPDAGGELTAGLMALGYRRPQAEAAAARVMGEMKGETNLSVLVKAALRILNS